MKAVPNLDLVRAVAVISVVVEHVLLSYRIMWYHGWEIQWIGVVGVFLFFVHTSLVLMWSLERKPHTLDFYIRRIFRIYPLAILAFLVTMIFHAPVNGTPNQMFAFLAPTHLSQVISALTLTPNLFGHYLPMSVMWSLPFEVEMYLVLPLLFFYVRSNFHTWPLLLLWGFMVMLGRATFLNIPYNLFTCVPYFLPGIMAYVGFGRRKAILPSWTLPIALGVMWFIFMLRPTWRRADFLCLAVGLGLPSFHQINAAWLTRASHQIAKYSYGIYLSHPFAITVGAYLLAGRSLVLQLLVISILLVILPVLVYHLLEKPCIQLGSRLANRAEIRFEQHELKQYRVSVAEAE